MRGISRNVLVMAWLLLLGGAGGLVAWLEMYAAETEQAIAAKRPTIQVDLSSQPEPSEGAAARGDGALPSRQNGAAGKRRKPRAAAAALHPHPDPALIEKAAAGTLPVIAQDGRQAWRVYAKPFSRLDRRPKIALVFTDLGISTSATQSVIEQTPQAVSLAFAPFARQLAAWIKASRAAGHEVLLNLPMEPFNYPRNDPGPFTLLTDLPPDQNQRRVHWVLGRGTGYVGVATFMASKFSTKAAALRPVLTELKGRGLMLLDSRENPLGVTQPMAKEIGIPYAKADLVVDQPATAEAIDQRLAELEALARKRGKAIGLARPFPISLKRVIRWADTLADRGVVLAPVSATVASRP